MLSLFPDTLQEVGVVLIPPIAELIVQPPEVRVIELGKVISKRELVGILC